MAVAVAVAADVGMAVAVAVGLIGFGAIIQTRQETKIDLGALCIKKNYYVIKVLPQFLRRHHQKRMVMCLFCREVKGIQECSSFVLVCACEKTIKKCYLAVILFFMSFQK